MPVSLPTSAQDRLLVLAPHPDDETIATGSLVQSALVAGAQVQVLFATDGDNNPWPQRWVERRWRIGGRERARWGARRRLEAQSALARLAVGGRTAAAHFLGWPDQGLTARLMHDDDAIATLRERLVAFEPSHVAMPVLDDAHPDHSALRVMVELALLQAGLRCVRLGYRVHGESTPQALRLAADATSVARKRGAMQAYVSQLALSRRRFLAMAERVEAFEAEPAAPIIEGNPATIAVRCEGPRARLQPRDLLLVLATRTGVLRMRCRVASLGTPAHVAFEDAGGRRIDAEWQADTLLLDLPPFARPVVAAWAKADRGDRRIVVYDREHWSAAIDPASIAVPASPLAVGR